VSTASYQKINYRLRPAKHVERRMIAEALRRLDRLSALNFYRYVGFGSPYFTDFSLFHKHLGINDMLSIERVVDDKPRFEFNKPFDCIDLEFGESNAILPGVDWNGRTILWLDYDKKLLQAHLVDVATFAANAVPLSVLLVTVNADPGALVGRADKMRSRLPKRVPIEASDDTLGAWGTAEVYRDILDEQITQTLHDRNHGMAPGAAVQYQQLFNFHYQDGVPMLTIGGIFFDEGLRQQVNACGFEEFSFHRPGAESCDITVPSITPKEMRALNEVLPSSTPEAIVQPGLSDDEIATYARTYRYFPTYVEAEL
jgi:hypothetical protein